MSNRNTMRAVNSPSIFHGAVESSFSGERKRRLWRIDRLAGEYYMLVLSEDMPDFSSLVKQFGFADEAEGWETRDYSPLLDRITNGSRWRFRLCANPVISHSVSGDAISRGKVCAIVGVDNQRKWLMQRAEKYGFELDDDEFDVVNINKQQFYKGEGSKKVSLLAVTYEGILTVTDVSLMRSALCEGIGRGKAYGVGMLTITGGRAND